jgi:hypothetical protein
MCFLVCLVVSTVAMAPAPSLAGAELVAHAVRHLAIRRQVEPAVHERPRLDLGSSDSAGGPYPNRLPHLFALTRSIGTPIIGCR